MLTIVGTTFGRNFFLFGAKCSDSLTTFLSKESDVKWSSQTTLLLLYLKVLICNLPFFKLVIHNLHNFFFWIRNDEKTFRTFSVFFSRVKGLTRWHFLLKYWQITKRKREYWRFYTRCSVLYQSQYQTDLVTSHVNRKLSD